MGAFKYLQEVWKHKQSDLCRFMSRIRTWEFRQLNAVHKVNTPTRPEKARKVGYKAKNGYAVFRVRVRRGDKLRQVKKGNVRGKPRNSGVHQQKVFCNHQNEAEQMVGRSIAAGMRVLNSYYVCKDGVHKYYEVIAVCPGDKTIRNDPRINWIVNAKHKHREMRGKTAAGRRHRGLRHRGLKSAHLRPSRRAFWRKNEKISLRRYR